MVRLWRLWKRRQPSFYRDDTWKESGIKKRKRQHRSFRSLRDSTHSVVGRHVCESPQTESWGAMLMQNRPAISRQVYSWNLSKNSARPHIWSNFEACTFESDFGLLLYSWCFSNWQDNFRPGGSWVEVKCDMWKVASVVYNFLSHQLGWNMIQQKTALFAALLRFAAQKVRMPPSCVVSENHTWLSNEEKVGGKRKREAWKSFSISTEVQSNQALLVECGRTAYSRMSILNLGHVESQAMCGDVGFRRSAGLYCRSQAPHRLRPESSPCEARSKTPGAQ